MTMDSEARRAYKREWERRKAQRQREKEGRWLETDPQIPGLLPIWRGRYRIADFARVDLDDWERIRHLHFTLAAGYPAVGTGRNRKYLHHLLLGRRREGLWPASRPYEPRQARQPPVESPCDVVSGEPAQPRRRL